MIEAEVILDSLAPNGVRLLTWQLTYPRFIHSELMTHRMFSRNASSSRAIPVRKVIDQIANFPAEPVHWGKNEPGMQASAELAKKERGQVKDLWILAAQDAIATARKMEALGAHKQLVNRILEPYAHISVIVTATEWANWFELRDHADAQPEIRALARAMKVQMDASVPQELKMGQWHLPYITKDDGELLPGIAIKCSVARCARVSYLTHDNQLPNIEKDLALFERLVGSRPLHASPTEHQATPLEKGTEWCKNFRGWKQYREEVESFFWKKHRRAA
jgi:thymidylate synthase ThyX